MDMMVEPGAASHHYGPRSGRRVRMSTPRRPYRTDLSYGRRALIEPTRSAWRAGRVGLGISPIQHDLREILNAILYVNRTGIAWEYLPHDFPPYKTVHGYFALWEKEGITEAIHDVLRGRVRRAAARRSPPRRSWTRRRSKRRATCPSIRKESTPARRSRAANGMSPRTCWACCWSCW